MAATVVACIILLLVSYSEGHYENYSTENTNRYENCSTNRTVLEMAFFETGENLNELDRVFFPLRTESSRFIIVNYTFFNESKKEDNCSVTYIWVVGEALFLQPPKIFELTSLLFSNPTNDLQNLSLHLPNECRRLVNKTKNCSCTKDSSDPLEIFTQQLDEYAKFSSPSNVVRDNTISSGRVICKDKLADEFYNGFKPKYHLYIIVTLLLPVLLLMSGFSFIPSINKKVRGKVEEKNYLNLVGLALTSTYVLLYIFACDFAALVYYITGNHDYKGFNIKYGQFNLIAVFITFITNFLLCITHIAIVVVMVFKNQLKNLPCSKYCKEVDTICFLSLLLLFPSLSLTSHIGYILLAWLTEPSKATGVGFVSFGSVLFLFAIFRNTYNYFLSCKTLKNNRLCLWLKCCCLENSVGGVKNKKFCCTSFILSVAFGIVPVSTLCSIFASFYLIPLKTLPLADYLTTFFSAVIIFFSALAAYGIISLSKRSAFHEFIEGFTKTCNDLDKANEQPKKISEEGGNRNDNGGAGKGRNDEGLGLIGAGCIQNYGTVDEQASGNPVSIQSQPPQVGQEQAPVESLQTGAEAELTQAGRDFGIIAKAVYNKCKEN